MNIKKKIVAIKDKAVAWTQDNPEDFNYYLGFAVATVGSLAGALIGLKIAENINEHRRNELWDEKEAKAIEALGEGSMPVRLRNGTFGFVGPSSKEE